MFLIGTTRKREEVMQGKEYEVLTAVAFDEIILMEGTIEGKTIVVLRNSKELEMEEPIEYFLGAILGTDNSDQGVDPSSTDNG